MMAIVRRECDSTEREDEPPRVARRPSVEVRRVRLLVSASRLPTRAIEKKVQFQMSRVPLQVMACELDMCSSR